MWWNDPAFEKTIIDSNQNEWSFKVWQDVKGNNHVQKIYFWDAKKEATGILEFRNDQTLHFRRIKDRIIKLANDKSYREKYLCELKFPIEQYY